MPKPTPESMITGVVLELVLHTRGVKAGDWVTLRASSGAPACSEPVRALDIEEFSHWSVQVPGKGIRGRWYYVSDAVTGWYPGDMG